MSAAMWWSHSRAIAPGIFSMHNARHFSTSLPLCELRFMARVNVVDNSDLGKAAKTSGKAPRIIHVYNPRQVGFIGDKVLLAINKQKSKAIIVGCRQKQRPMVPRFDSNNVVLIDDEYNPIGTRITVPIPEILRKREELSKVLAISSRLI